MTKKTDKEWRKIPGFGDKYIVSNDGEVRSLFCGHGTRWKCGEKLLTQRPDFKGYLKVKVRVNGQDKIVFVHRLVALAFLPKVKGKNMVNHKDGDKQNNSVDNLEWCDNSENQLHSFRVLGRRQPNWLLKLLKEKSSRPVRCVETGVEYPSISEAARSVGAKSDSHIGEVCRGVANTAAGYHWEYADGTEC